MTIQAIAEQLELVARQSEFDNREVTGAYTSDLLSDVMANAEDVELLITIQAHQNTVAVAALIGVTAIIVCNNRPVPDDMVNAARRERIGLFLTAKDQFTTSGRIYQML